MYTNVRGSSIFSSQKLETIQLSTGKRTNKLWYIYAIQYYLAIKNIVTIDMHNNVNESQNHCFQLKKLGKKW